MMDPTMVEESPVIDEATHASIVAAFRKARTRKKPGWIAVSNDESIAALLLVRLPRVLRLGLRRLGCVLPVAEHFVTKGKTMSALDLLAREKFGEPIYLVDGGSDTHARERFTRLLEEGDGEVAR